jgi:hypothetical protein
MLSYSGILFALAPFALLGLAIPYAVLKSRDARAEEHDPEIGLKSALYFIFSLAILIVLTGLTVLVVDALMESEDTSRNTPVFGQPPPPKPAKEFTEAQRVGWPASPSPCSTWC